MLVRFGPMRIIGHGIDAVEVARIAAMLQDHGERFIDRCFGEREREYAEAGSKVRAQRYAARFACKEAVMKALGTGWANGISWHDIEIGRDPSGQPHVLLTGRGAELASKMKIAQWHLSITHTRDLAIASVIATD